LNEVFPHKYSKKNKKIFLPFSNICYISNMNFQQFLQIWFKSHNYLLFILLIKDFNHTIFSKKIFRGLKLEEFLNNMVNQLKLKLFKAINCLTQATFNFLSVLKYKIKI
jgi:hypothetical protein